MNAPHLQAAGAAASQALRELETGAVDSAMAARDAAARESARVGAMARDWWQRRTDQAWDAAHAVKQEALTLGDNAQRYVRDEPAKSLLWAALAGALLAAVALLRLRRSR